jgi:hypothetical protein
MLPEAIGSGGKIDTSSTSSPVNQKYYLNLNMMPRV